VGGVLRESPKTGPKTLAPRRVARWLVELTPGLGIIATTWQPLATSCATSRSPTALAAPTTTTFMVDLRRAFRRDFNRQRLVS